MDVVPIPEQRARDKRPIHLEFIPRSFPGQRVAVRMDWNSYQGKWTVEIEHLRREYVITKSIATPYRPFSYLPYLVFLFADPSGKQKEVTPENLGAEMQLYVLPGPSGRQPGDQ